MAYGPGFSNVNPPAGMPAIPNLAPGYISGAPANLQAPPRPMNPSATGMNPRGLRGSPMPGQRRPQRSPIGNPYVPTTDFPTIAAPTSADFPKGTDAHIW